MNDKTFPEMLAELRSNMETMPEEFLQQIATDYTDLQDNYKRIGTKSWTLADQCVGAMDLCHTIPRLIEQIRSLRAKT
jgi:DNA-directed RNA polymerase delta subunit